MLRAYLAGRFTERKRLRVERTTLKLGGVIDVVADWLDVKEDVTGESEQIKAACHDLRQVKDADFLILDLEGDQGGSGRFVEFGAALAWGKPVWLVLGEDPGARWSVFHSLAVKHFKNWDELHRWAQTLVGGSDGGGNG